MGSNKPRDPEWVARFERLSPPLPRGKLWRLLGNPRNDAEAVKQIKRRESSEVDRHRTGVSAILQERPAIKSSCCWL